MKHHIHTEHKHVHNEYCGHMRIEHDGHVDYLHDGHLHHAHQDHYDEHVIAVTETNPAVCAPLDCACGHEGCGHAAIPHGDHIDYIVNGRLHHPHGDHCDDHGPVTIIN
ncbi:hypothetical protein [Methylotuvimicrobium alcaliphilum]|uniref:Threonine dehydratase n=1 Tax=Methylotuvimicrobium alcaliphilum (strain DSM 19304 / NCIMB 14124 / VKM B-2133 / 20Z) TaxID=1091494 RepID=G4T1D0_META2|nr:hypothetical protein [Methylotuvimicrobium alcaliphilum]CCE25679.1 conserved protein of unknown function [Methylotuvimicrobium alcaliphilum 20Z]